MGEEMVVAWDVSGIVGYELTIYETGWIRNKRHRSACV
jgi:hypothetical protein